MRDVESEPLLAGPILGVVGGLLILIYGAYEAWLGTVLRSTASFAGFPTGDITAVIVGGVIGVFLGVVVILCSVGLALSPERHRLLGSLIILLALVSLVSVGGGGGIGLLLCVLGGTCGVVFGPSKLEPLETPAEILGTPAVAAPTAGPTSVPRGSTAPADEFGRTHKGCPGCSRILPLDTKKCPECGTSFE